MPGTWEEARSGCVGWCSRLDVLTKLCAAPVKAGGDQSGAVLPTLVHPHNPVWANLLNDDRK